MPTIAQAGTLNLAAQVLPDLRVIIVPPQNRLINGVPTSRVGVIGTASWGVPGQPGIVGDYPAYVRAYGPLRARKYDMGTHVATAIQQGANDFRCVRVSDGTDTAAQLEVVVGAFLLVATCTGTVGNTIRTSITTGSKPSSFRLTVGVAGQVPEVFDNITGTGAAFWTALAAAVNTGVGVLGGASRLVVAIAEGGATPPAPLIPTALTGGTDGADGVTQAMLTGLDGPARTGMYALRGQGCSLMLVSDCDDATQWTTQAGYCQAEGMYPIVCGPSGDTIVGAIATKQAAGADAYALKVMFGDWTYWNDPQNRLLRVVSPQGFVAGRLANLSPEQSSGNKPLYGVVATQKSGAPGTAAQATYSDAELTALVQAGIDVITNPVPRGPVYGVRFGRNASSDPNIYGDNYVRLTNFIAKTLLAAMGGYVQEVVNRTLLDRMRATQLAFLNALFGQNILSSVDGTLPYDVVCDTSNNPPNRLALGYVISTAQVRYGPIADFINLELEGGQGVVITGRRTSLAGQA